MNGDKDVIESLVLKSSIIARTEKKDIVSRSLGELVSGVGEQKSEWEFYGEYKEMIGRSNILWIEESS